MLRSGVPLLFTSRFVSKIGYVPPQNRFDITSRCSICVQVSLYFFLLKGGYGSSLRQRRGVAIYHIILRFWTRIERELSFCSIVRLFNCNRFCWIPTRSRYPPSYCSCPLNHTKNTFASSKVLAGLTQDLTGSCVDINWTYNAKSIAT